MIFRRLSAVPEPVLLALVAVVLGYLIIALEKISRFDYTLDYTQVTLSVYLSASALTVMAFGFRGIGPWLLLMAIMPVGLLNAALVLYGFPNHLAPLALLALAVKSSLRDRSRGAA